MVEHHPVMGNLSVLLLDDNPTSLWIISNMLVESGFKVIPFQKVEVALDFVKSRAAIEEELDLVLAEVYFCNIAPGSLANSELLHHILNELQVPVITMCAHYDEEALSEHVSLGACSHVLKPLDTASLNMLKQKALEHKSKKATPQGPIPNRTKSRMVSSSTERLQEMLILEGNNLSNPGNSEFEVPEVEKADGCSKKLDRVTWTVELHEKFLDAIEVLGDKNATPEKIRRLMNVKGLTWKHIGSHLQKHRSRKQNANQGGQHQRNASKKLVSELIGSGQTAATTESITSRVDADIREAYPSRMWKQVKEEAALKTYMYTSTSGISRDGTKSVWDEYQKGLQKKFSASNKRWQQIGQSSSKCQLPVKNNVVVIDGGVSSEAPKATGEIGYGASIESSGSSSLSTSLADQVGEKNHTEASGKNYMGNINLLEGTMNTDASDLLAFLLSDDLDLLGPFDGWEEQVSDLMSELQGSVEQRNLGLEDPLQVDNAWNKDLALPSHINTDGSMAQEVTFENVPVDNAVVPIAQANGSSQDRQNLGLEDPLQVDNTWNKGLESPSLINIDGSMAQEPTVQNGPVIQSITL